MTLERLEYVFLARRTFSNGFSEPGCFTLLPPKHFVMFFSQMSIQRLRENDIDGYPSVRCPKNCNNFYCCVDLFSSFSFSTSSSSPSPQTTRG